MVKPDTVIRWHRADFRLALEIAASARRQHLDGIWHQTIQRNKDHAIHGTEGQSLRLVASLDVKGL
jgi:hypothetical protein